jgi:hypothetical protein
VGTLDLEEGDYEQLPCRFPDGSQVLTRSTLGTASVSGLGHAFSIVIAELGQESLVGRGILDEFKLTLDHGRTLTIER